MATSKKSLLAHRFFSISRFTNPSSRSRNPATPPLTKCLMRSDPGKPDPDPGDSRIFKKIIQWRNLYQSAAGTATSPALIRSIPTGERLLERLRDMGIARDRIRLDGLIPFPSMAPEETEKEKEKEKEKAKEGLLSIGDVRKLLRASKVEAVKATLRDLGKDWIAYSEFVDICCRENGKEEGMVYAKMLDESGSVIVLRNSVCLRPQQGD